MTSTRHLSPPAFHAITTKLFIKRMCRKQYSQNKERIPCLQINHIITKPVFWNYHLRDPWTWSWLFITYSGMADRFYIPLDIFSTRRKIQTKPAKVERTRIDSCHKKKKSRARLAISQALYHPVYPSLLITEMAARYRAHIQASRKGIPSGSFLFFFFF